jgi:tetratricopeptide (TPR) repeat protein
MGTDYMHIHHYCAGLNFVNRARNMPSSARRRQGTLDAAIGNFDYFLAHIQPSFYLRPDALMNRGIALSLLNRQGEATSNLLQAIEMNPKLTPAYTTLSSLYEKQKNRSKALETVSDGLRHNPGTKSLQRRYDELGGKAPYPAPIEPVLVESPVKPASSQASPGEPVAETPTTVTPAVEPVVAPKIGSPKNPYCRFCPD